MHGRPAAAGTRAQRRENKTEDQQRIQEQALRDSAVQRMALTDVLTEAIATLDRLISDATENTDEEEQ